MDFSKGNIYGLIAITLWGLLALITTGTAGLPPLFVTAVSFIIAGVLSCAYIFAIGKGTMLRQPLRAWALAVGALYFFHICYFAALKLAPPAEAGLIEYLWPLLIVLFSSLLPNEPKLEARHIISALLGLLGVGILVFSRGEVNFRSMNLGSISSEYMAGYALALLCGFIWAAYSVALKQQGEIPTEAMAGFCLVTGLLALITHFGFEASPTSLSLTQIISLFALGFGPVGIAFFLWDYGVKKGDIRFLGVASYASPVISTLALIAAGEADATWALGLASLLIIGGAYIARNKG